MNNSYLLDPNFDARFNAMSILFHKDSRKVDLVKYDPECYQNMGNRIVVTDTQNTLPSFSEHNRLNANRMLLGILEGFYRMIVHIEAATEKKVKAITYSSDFHCISQEPWQRDYSFEYGFGITFEPIFE